MKLYTLLILCLIISIPSLGNESKKSRTSNKFILVIDPGHGGKDPGAIGRITNEKTINLNVALAFGKLISQKCPDVEVIYTRKKDIYIPLEQRAEIANKANADLFISIHTNALPKRRIAYGAETYSLGMARAKENLDVAKRENAVILLEKDYKEKYSNFNPNSSESYIIFEFMQDKYMRQSVDLANFIQQKYTSEAKRQNKGVHQAGFLVLRNTTMPSILTELGFITTPQEERFLHSKKGINKMAYSLYKGFLNYKSSYNKSTFLTENFSNNKKTSNESIVNNSKVTVSKTDQKKKNYRIQLFATKKKKKLNDKIFKGIKSISYYKENGLYKYTSGNYTNYTQTKKAQNSLRKKFPKCFIVTFLNDKKIQ